MGLILHRFIFNLIIKSNWGVTWQPPITILVITILAGIVRLLLPFTLSPKKSKKWILSM